MVGICLKESGVDPAILDSVGKSAIPAEEKRNRFFPEQVEFHRVLKALKLTQPNLSILMGTLESRASGYALSELKRLSVKLFGRQFLEASEDVLRIESGR